VLEIFHFISNERCAKLTNIPMKAAKHMQDKTASQFWFSEITKIQAKQTFAHVKIQIKVQQNLTKTQLHL